MGRLQEFVHDDQGAVGVEVGLMAALIGAAILTGMATFGTSLGDMWNWVIGEVVARLI